MGREYALRTEEVHAWQRNYNMEPRDDSKLTVLYAEGNLSMSAAEVARELMATEFVYRNTLYGELIERFMRCVAKRIHDTYRISWTATWAVVRFYAPNALKLMSISATGAYIPEHLPHPQEMYQNDCVPGPN